MKTGDPIVCIKDRPIGKKPSFTVGNEYTIGNVSLNLYTVVDDSGEDFMFDKKNFHLYFRDKIHQPTLDSFTALADKYKFMGARVSVLSREELIAAVVDLKQQNFELKSKLGE